MKYFSFLPLTALLAFSVLHALVYWQIIPPGSAVLELISNDFSDAFYALIFLIILLESIVYVGFYFPGQLFAVILVIGANPAPKDIVYLTIAMVAAATLGSLGNYLLGRFSNRNKGQTSNSQFERVSIRSLLLAMIHINSLAFFMFAQGANQKPIKIIALAGLLNLPYYLLLIAGTSVLSEQVMAMTENTLLLFSLISIWLIIALYFDFKKYKKSSATL